MRVYTRRAFKMNLYMKGRILNTVLLRLAMLACGAFLLAGEVAAQEPVVRRQTPLYVQDSELVQKLLQTQEKEKVDTVPERRVLPEKERKKVLKKLVKNMRHIKGDSFVMGATNGQKLNSFDYERPTHWVKLSSYYIGKYEVTQLEWVAVMGYNPSAFKGDERPVENVSWDECQLFIARLDSLTGKHFRLPTEAEWEYAARGGKWSADYRYSGSFNLKKVGWYKDNSAGETSKVGLLNPNHLGLYDMSGNVMEWCNDLYGFYTRESVTDPQGPSEGAYRVFRGGSWHSPAILCRVSFRDVSEPEKRGINLGFRLAMTPEKKDGK